MAPMRYFGCLSRLNRRDQPVAGRSDIAGKSARRSSGVQCGSTGGTAGRRRFQLVARKKISSRLASPGCSENFWVDFGQRAVDDLSAVLQNQDARADFLDQVQQVRADDDGGAVARAFQDGILHPPDADADPARSAVRQSKSPWANAAGRRRWRAFVSCRGTIRRAAHLACSPSRVPPAVRRRSFVIRHLINPGDEIQMLPDGEIIEQARFVGEKRRVVCLAAIGVPGDVVAARRARCRGWAG